MINHDLYWEMTELKVKVDSGNKLLNEMKGLLRPEQELWDNEDMISFWHVSSRTLATWRAEGIIGYVQVGGKIWYPREARKLFLESNFIKAKVGEEKDGVGN